MQRTAECCCGQSTITVEGEPLFHGVCHCDNCKKRTGSAFGISTYFTKEQVVKSEGTTGRYRLHHEQLNHDQERCFCANCGTTLYWMISTMPDRIGIAGGCFIQQPLNEPTAVVSSSKQCAWVTLPEQWEVLS
ncbi:MAG: GFA family protein [Cellvibrionaceae bacterium]